jgi:hypothetical protein
MKFSVLSRQFSVWLLNAAYERSDLRWNALPRKDFQPLRSSLGYEPQAAAINQIIA